MNALAPFRTTSLAAVLALVALIGTGCEEAPTAAPEVAVVVPTSTAPTAAAPAPVKAPIEPQAAPAPTEKTTAVASTKPSPTAGSPDLKINRLVVTRNVEGREPVDAADQLELGEANRVYAFVEVNNPSKQAGEVIVAFEPPNGGPAVGNVRLSVGASPRWRTWAFTRGVRQRGEWTAVVKDLDGEVLAKESFQII